MATDVRQLHVTVPVERRRTMRRAPANTRASVRTQGEHATDAKLLDLSIYGCRLGSTGAYNAGDRLWLRLDGGWPVAGTVVWVEGERLGCRFDQPIASTTMRDLTRVMN